MNANTSFTFSPDNAAQAKVIIARYPEGRQQSAVMPLLDLAQRQAGGWLPREVLDYIAEYLDMPRIRVYEVATFYTMYNTKPVGRHLVQLCRTTPCWLRGSEDILNACRDFLGIGLGETTEDGLFSLMEVECLGACCNAPMMQINDDFYEDLDADATRKVLEGLKKGEQPKTGSQTGRVSSEPVGELTTLKHQQRAEGS